MFSCKIMSVQPTAATSGFIDLASFGELEGFLYGGMEAVTLFIRSVQKANWFTIIPVTLRLTGTHDFGVNASARLSRSADYILGAWMRAQIPKIELTDGTPNAQTLRANASIRWTRFLMHNLFEQILLKVNEVDYIKFDSFWLDFNYQFRVPGGKKVGYRNMVGDINDLTNAVGVYQPLGTGGFYQMPFPFSFFDDNGYAIPAASLPFNEINIEYTIRDWKNLVVVFPGTGSGTAASVDTHVKMYSSSHNSTDKPALQKVDVYAHYALVHHDERAMMGDAPRDILIRQPQTLNVNDVPTSTDQYMHELRLSHAISFIVFGFWNKTIWSTTGAGAEWSNYTTEPNYNGSSPIAAATLRYDSTARFSMGADYYALTVPYYFCKDAIPEETGYNALCFALDMWSPDPCGSTGFSKLNHAALEESLSTACKNSRLTVSPVGLDGELIQWPDASGTLVDFPQKFAHIGYGYGFNVVRASNGSLGFPTL